MKNKLIGILLILIIIIAMPLKNFAAEESGYQGIDTDIVISGDTSSVPVINSILGTLQVVGTIVSVVALIIIGMRYMLSSVEEKAQMKGVIGYYITGCVLVFATTNVLSFAYDIIDDVRHDWTVIDDKPATCTTEGYKKFKCNICGEVETVTLSALGHKWVEGHVYNKEPKKCNEYSKYYKNCEVCYVSSEEITRRLVL